MTNIPDVEESQRRRQSERSLFIFLCGGLIVGATIGYVLERPALGAGLGGAVAIAIGASWKRDSVPVLKTEPTDLEALNAYIDGKMKRYTFLFAVNGGAFAVGQFLLKDEGQSFRAVPPLRYLADGAMVFTAVMTVHVWLFGRMVREQFVGDAAFTAAGKALLVLISLLLIGGWFVVSARAPAVVGG